MTLDLIRYRNANIIIGYRKKEKQGYYSYSKDLFWWSQNELNGEIYDEYSGIKDKNNRELFTNDIIELSRSKDEKEEFIIKVDETNLYYIESIESNKSYQLFAGDLCLFNKTDIQFIGFNY